MHVLHVRFYDTFVVFDSFYGLAPAARNAFIHIKESLSLRSVEISENMFCNREKSRLLLLPASRPGVYARLNE